VPRKANDVSLPNDGMPPPFTLGGAPLFVIG
jgi:hypothetical protein